MSQSAALKKKGSNPNKAQSPLKNLNFDMQYRSSTELANQFKIKREQLANERNDKAKKEHVPIAHKRKNSEDLILQTKKRLFQSGESIQEKRIKLPMQNFRFQMSSKQGVTDSVYVTGETFGNSEVKRKSIIGDETKTDNHTVADDLVDQEEINRDECAIEEEIGIDCSTKEILEAKKVRGKTTCKDIHARNLEERKEVTFGKGQAVGPTGKIVSEFTNFIGTISRNPRFINLMYTSWHAVPEDTKKRMWEYINSKFIIPIEGKAWVMTGFRDAWKRYKQKIKERFFDKNSTIEDMLAKRPSDIAEDEFRQLIEYWKDPTVQAMCEMNSQNRKKQKWRHRMGPISFARVRVALRATKENNEEPSKSEMFIATRTKTGKELQADTQIAIAELQNRQNSGETTDDAFTAVFGKEQPGRLRCYGRSVTPSSLKNDEEDSKLKQKHANEITSLKEEMNEMREEIREEMREEMRNFFSQLLQNNPGLNVRGMQGGVVSNIASPIDAGSAQAVKGQNPLQSSRSTHDPILQKLLLVALL
ncbi:uncharacterized protein LOC107017483 [Solanum pennellii]|uniref:Uncharacterized protein LOC107017483 n=1 Tax=Solanum pennellii TaxID=28526 RepID=A0ABM1V9G6_SOLPN|nr:uncharacterized protein LOC107017483 [Solanum pennellii]